MPACAGAQLKTIYWLIPREKSAAESGFIDMEQIPFDYCRRQQRRILTTGQAGHTVKEMINIPDIRFPLANRSLTQKQEYQHVL